MFRDLQMSGLSRLRRADQVAELLHETVAPDPERVQFLRLHPCIPVDGAGSKSQCLAGPRPSPETLREARELLAGPRSGEMESALRLLGRHWLVRVAGKGFGVEIWSEGMDVPARAQAKAKHMVFLSQNPRLGLCASLPQEVGRLLERRCCLSVSIEKLGDPPPVRAGEGLKAAVLSDSRGQALHRLLSEAQEALWDRSTFCRLQADVTRMSEPRWHLLRNSSWSVALMYTAAEGDVPVCVHVAFGPGLPCDSGRGRQPLEHLAAAAELHLRDTFLDVVAAARQHAPAATEGPGLFGSFVRWATPLLEAALRS